MTKVLPQGWVECKLGDIGDWGAGLTPLKSQQQYYEEGTVSWVRTGDLNDSYIDHVPYKINEIVLTETSLKIKPVGSVLIAMYGATIGKIGILNIEATTNQACCACIVNQGISNLYLFYFLLFNRDRFKKLGVGGAQPNISKAIIVDYLISLPPLNEQKRIVDKIEDLFADIDSGIKDLENSIEQIKKYRQSVLKAAFDGKLYKTTKWKEIGLNDILSKDKHSMKRGPFGSSLKKEFFVENGVRVFEQYNPINNDPYWSRYYIDNNKFNELKTFKAIAGDFLISCSGTIGSIVELPNDVEEGIINQALLKITLDNNKIINSFFIHLFRGPKMQREILKSVIGTAIKNIASVKDLKLIQIMLPSLSEQEQIVKEIEKRFEVADELEDAVRIALQNAEKLKQSILKKAFEGKLVLQDPKDEPASKLLEKIKAEKMKNPQIKRVRNNE